MTQASKLTYPILFDFVAASAVYAANAQRLNEVFMDTFKRLSEVRTRASAEACVEGFSHMIAISGAQGLSGMLAGWPPLLQSVIGREAKVQQRNVDIWALALQATTDLSTGHANKVSAGANGSGLAAGERMTERRVSARVIQFPDRRAHAAGSNGAGAREGAPVRRRAAVARG